MTALRLHRQVEGYTLVELLVVLAILGILAGMAMPMAEVVAQREREQELKRALWTLRDAIDSYKKARDNGALQGSPEDPRYPPSLDALTRLYSDARAESKGQPLRFLREVPRDPFADPGLPADKTWALRSYLSEATRPEPGADVYDVHSASLRKALDGTALKDW